jgi:hypothetical protein
VIALLPVLTMLLGVLVGYLSQSMYEARLLRRYAPIVFCAPMSTTLPTTVCSGGCPDQCVVTDWTEEDAHDGA